MSQPGQQPRIVGDWTPVDTSSNTLELALTDQMVHARGGNGQQQVIALRDSYNQQAVIFVTPGQIQSFSKAIDTENSRAANVLQAATSGSTGR